MVISQKMMETEMGYRGSKSIIVSAGAHMVSKLRSNPAAIVVKEQRVDGS